MATSAPPKNGANPRKVLISQMSEHFLYLPLYYAKSQDYFGYVDSSQYIIQIREPFEKTDAAVIREVMNAYGESRDVKLAICDPTQIYQFSEVERGDIAILSAIISETAIWAIDKDAPPVMHLTDLQSFQNIISYGEGSTTHAIARRIAGPNHTIWTVNPRQEFRTLLEFESAVALSPDILYAVQAEKERGRNFRIILPISQTGEYGNVLVTALLGSRAFVVEHPALVQGIIKALHKAIEDIRANDPALIPFASHFFRQDEDVIEEALLKANQAAVYASSPIIQQGAWDRASRAYFQSTTIVPSENDISRRALDVYSQLIEPHSHLANSAIRLRALPSKTISNKTMSRWIAVCAVATVLALLGTTGFMIFAGVDLVGKWPAAVVAFLAMAVLGLISTWARRIRGMTKGGGLLLCFYLAVALTVAICIVFGIETGGSFAVFLVVITDLYEIYKETRDQKS